MGPLLQLAYGREKIRPAARGRFRYVLPPIVLALVGLGFVAFEVITDLRDVRPLLAGVIAAGSVLPVAVAYRWPVAAWRLMFPMLFLGVAGAVPDESWPWNTVQIVGALLVLGRLAAVSESMVTIWATILTLVPVFLFAPDANAWGAGMLVVAIAALGDIVSRRRRTRELLAEQSEINELERAKRAVLEERTRIAREMHDVVAHHMSMIAVQAETAPYRLAGLPDGARNELAEIAGAARAALTDMRRLLGVLRAEGQDAERVPQPGYGQIAELVAATRRAGLPVVDELSELDEIGEAAGLAAYRIVQEALANAAQHAPGGPVRLRARATGDRLELCVRNKLTTTPDPGRRPGHGLIGMHERVALLGGELTAGPDGAGHYEVLARIPLQPEAR
ncbi:sensor histidine kinase [Actinoplanes regularis]|uniref:histidine kinase n=1 Tax=Actinoplanes regularis TaxID=52697 RepID=A0A238WBL3_9ACTN|nr:histidine kinase [Actinoplanes regularis]GIE85079.1 two-component sensor histidine kinase [Actinoplanes regularis]SNR43674.1 Signal transduction histidine kinase [Actinoplanes regularis]